MRITKVIAENVKGLDFDLELHPVTVIVAANDVGKTAVLDAVNVALMGYKPGLGKQGVATMKLAGDKKLEMRCLVEAENGKKASANFKRKNDGGTTSEVESELGAVEILNMKEFFRRPSADQQNYFMSRLDMSGFENNDPSLLEKLGALEALPVAEGVKGRDEMLKVVNTSIARRTAEKTNLQTWFGQLIDLLKAERKSIEATRKNLGGASVTFRNDATAPKSKKVEIDAKRKMLDDVNRRIQEFDFTRKQHESQASRRAELEAIINAPLPTVTGDVAELEKKVAGYKSKTPALTLKVEEMRNKVTVLNTEKAQIKATLEELKKKLQDVEHQKKCPYCRSSRKDWKDEVRVDLQGQITDTEARLATHEGLITTAIKEGQAIRANLDQSTVDDQKQQELTKTLKSLQNDLQRVLKAKGDQDKARAELSGLNAIPGTNPAVLEELIRQQAGFNSELAILTTAELEYDAWQANAKKRKELEASGLAAYARSEIYKKAIAIVSEEQERIVAQAFDSILAPARRITDGILPGQLAFRHGSIGIIDPDRGWVSYETFSGNWETIVFAALSVALAQQSAVKVVMLDELGTIGPERKKALLERLVVLASEGFIDNAIACDLRNEGWDLDPQMFKVIELS